jgi:putative RNA 2'-phosphotransferase
MKRNLRRLGKQLAYLLRHHPEAENLTIDKKGGWVDVDDVLLKLGITLEDLKEVVIQDNKSRFSFEDKSFRRIRANQGHSIEVDLELKPVVPPAVLYHGTAKRFLESIKERGITRKERHHVHLSKDIESAISVGKRHGKPVVIVIDSKKMNHNGIRFYISENEVFLTKHVSPEFFKEILYV